MPEIFRIPQSALRSAPKLLNWLLAVPPGGYLHPSEECPLYWITNPAGVELILSSPMEFPKAPAMAEYRAFLGDGTSATFYAPPQQSGDATSEHYANFRLQKRRAIAPSLNGTLKTNRDTAIEDIAKRATASWMPNQSVDVYAVLHDLFFQIALHCLFQVEVSDALLDANATLRQTAGDAAAYVQSPQNCILPYFDRGKPLSPAWEKQQCSQYARLRARRHNLDLILDFIISAVAHDTRSPLLEKVRALPLNDETDLRAVLAGLLLASYENSATWIAWALYCLAIHNDLQNRIVEDSHNLREDSLLSFCLSETLRLYPPVWSLARQAKCELVLKNQCVIPAGSIIFISPYVQQRHPALWEDAVLFNPYRFTMSDTTETGRYCPFGHELHGCYGESFARDSVRIVLNILLRDWKFSVSSDYPAPAMAFGLTQFPSQGVWLRVAWRG